MICTNDYVHFVHAQIGDSDHRVSHQPSNERCTEMLKTENNYNIIFIYDEFIDWNQKSNNVACGVRLVSGIRLKVNCREVS